MDLNCVIGNLKVLKLFNKKVENSEATLDLAIEAVEKQITKEPIVTVACGKNIYSCPCCGRGYMETYYIMNYCDLCGQKLLED